MIRAFIGIRIIWPGYEKLKYEIQKEECIFGKWVESSNLHITLKFLGNTDEEVLEKIKLELNNHKINSFEATFKSLGCFPNENNPRVLFINGFGNFVPLKNFVEKTCEKYSFQRENQDFIPHLTLLRIKKLKRKNKFLSLLRKYKDKEFFKVKITSFQLFQSILTSQGPIYKVLSEYKLF